MKPEQKRKLEIALCSYLPHRLNMAIPKGYRFSGFKTDAKYLRLDGLKSNGYLSLSGTDCYYPIEHFKLILRPLSDLTKPIEYNGDKFVPMDNINKKSGDKLTHQEWVYFTETIYNKKGYDNIQHWIYQDLIKWHFDVFSLIDNNLAININDIK